ncbi:unnamed protein product [Rotaria sordida]|uniref:Uncharacterized protein n=1 Tax=Rotaria sordida TaxID=392033 RepID=A0A814NKP2_9BILA|nr:unnamed protein product [Rotaria sordida]CAF1290841.1 unnamed protein product [Rotaria sordida]
MTAFARPSLLDNRYAVIAETSAYTYDDDDLVNYAEFLRQHGRYMTKGGYVDSSRRIRSLHRQQDGFQIPKRQTPPSRTGLLASINKSSLSAPAIGTTPRKLKTSDENELLSPLSLSANPENKKKEYDKQMKLIEEQMIKAKQNEREAKRLEGDIKKEQRQLHHSLRDLDVDATRKRYNAEKHLSKNLEEKDKIEREFVKKREKYTTVHPSKTLAQITYVMQSSRTHRSFVNRYLSRQTKERTDRLIDSLQANKDKDRRNLLLCNDLARQYQTKSHELKIKHQQFNQIHSDFEQKVQQKELEENRLKKELADIATALNLEAQKVKTDMKDFLNIVDNDRVQTMKQDLEQEQKLNQTNVYGKNYDQERRRLSGDVTLHRSMLDLKQRDALRRIGDTKSRLETIYAKQRQLNASTAINEPDRRATQLMSKVTDIENRRSQLMNQYMRDKTEKHESEATTKAKTRPVELETKQHEDRLRHLENTMNKSEDVEYELRKSVKEAEFQRRKKEQEVQRLKDDLIRKKREDAKKIQNAIARSEQEEKELERHLAKEKAKLYKLQTRREDNYLRLTRQRQQMRENKALLDIHEREHERLLNVQTQSQSLQSFNTI